MIGREFEGELSGTIGTLICYAEEIHRLSCRGYNMEDEMRWDEKITRLHKQGKFRNINLNEAKEPEEIAIYNLFVLVRKFLCEIYKSKEAFE